jgi:hypothetical protein
MVLSRNNNQYGSIIEQQQNSGFDFDKSLIEAS